MAQVNDLLVLGKANFIDILKFNQINVPTEAGGTAFGPGSSGQVLKSNGSTVYWGTDSNPTLSGLGGIGTITATGTSPLTLTATKTGTSVAITGSVDLSITRHLTSGTKMATIKLGGTNYDLYCQTNTDAKVTQSEATVDTLRPIILGKTNSSSASGLTTSVTDVVHVTSKFYANPGKGILYAPTFSGNLTGNVTGNVSGTAGSADLLNENERVDYGWNGLTYFNKSMTVGNAAGANDAPTSNWWHIIRTSHGNSNGYYTDLALPLNDPNIYYKRINNGNVKDGGWIKLLDANNYTGYTVKKDGTGASGRWDIQALKLANYYTSRQTTIKPGIIGDGSVMHFKCTSTCTDTDKPGDGHILHFNWDNTGGYDAQLHMGTSTGEMKYRGMNSKTWTEWATVLSTANTSFTRTLTSGTKIGTIKINGTSTDIYCETNTNTDTKVTQSVSTTSSYRHLLLHYSTGTSPDSTTGQVYYAADIYAKPSNGTLYATTFSGNLTGNVTGNVSGTSGGLNSNVSAIELNAGGTLASYGGFIDFHYHNASKKPTDASGTVVSATPDYTSRIIENAAGQIAINSVTIKGSTITGTLSGNASSATVARSMSSSYDRDTSNYHDWILYHKANGTTIHQFIGGHNTGGDGDGSIILVPCYDGTTDRWAKSKGLHIGSATVTFNGNTVLHTGNYTGTLDSRYVKKAGDTMTGNLSMNATGKGYYLVDSSGATYPGICDNGSNLWLGSVATAAKHHRGSTYISAGHNGTTGNSTIYVSVPNDANSNATNYAVAHANNVSFSAWTAGTASAGPKINLSVAGSTKTSAAIPVATNAVCGVTKVWKASDCTQYTDDTYALTTAAVKKAFTLFGAKNGVYYVTGNTTGTAGTWTGSNTDIPSLFTGLTIAYKIGIAGADTTTLDLTTAAGASGAKTVYRNNGKLTTHLPVNTVVHLTYDGTYWRWADYDANTYGRSGNTTSKIFLMGTTSQSTSNKTSYSNVGCYASGGYLYSNSTKVSVEGHTHSYLPLSGGTMTGPINNATLVDSWVAACKGGALINSTRAVNSFHPMLSGATTNGRMTVAFYQTALRVGYITKANCDSNTNTLTQDITLANESGGGIWPGTVSAGNFCISGSTGNGVGVGLHYNCAADTYGIHMSKTSTYGTHGSVTGTWATYFTMSGDANRGWIFRHAGANKASISSEGFFDGPRVDAGCLRLTNSVWTGYGALPPDQMGLTAVTGRVYFQLI